MATEEHELQQQMAYLEVIHKMAIAVSRAKTPVEVYDLALEGVQAVLDIDCAALLTLEPGSGFYYQNWINLSPDFRESTAGPDILRPSADETEPLLLSDVERDTHTGRLRMAALEEGIRALALIPIVLEGELLGQFILGCNQPYRFPEPVVKLTMNVASYVALAIEQERIQRQEEENRQLVETLQHIGASLVAELDLQNVVQAVTDAATQLTGAAFGAFFYNVIDEKGEAYTLYTLSGAPQEAFSSFPQPRNTSVFGTTFRGEGVIRLDDVTEDQRYGNNPPYNGMPEGHLPVCSYLAVPVISRSGEVIGGLFFGHPDRGIFSKQDEQVALGIAGWAAVAVDNARLYDKSLRAREELKQAVAERTKDLQRANAELRRESQFVQLLQQVAVAANEGTSIESVLQFAVDAICAHTGWPLGHAYLSLTGEPTLLVSTDIWHLDQREYYAPFRKATAGLQMQPGIGIPGRVLASAQPIWIKDLHKDSNFPRIREARDLGIRAGFAFPVLVGRKVAAVLEFFTPVAVETDEAFLEVVAHIGAQLGRVIEREQAAATLKERERQLAEAQRVARLGSWELNWERKTMTWSDELYRIYGLSPETFDGTYESYLGLAQPVDQASINSTIEQASQSAKPFSFYQRVTHSNGSRRIVHTQGRVVLDDEDHVRMMGTAQDVTELKQTETALRRLARRVVTVQEAERRRLSRDLHDSIGQLLTALQLKLNILQNGGTEDKDDLQMELTEAGNMVSTLYEEIRSISHVLRPPALEQVGLHQTLRSLCHEFTRQTVLPIDYEGAETPPLPDEVSISFYRFLQEALTNTAKHAAAKRARVVLDYNEEQELLTLTIVDDGVGFDASKEMALTNSGGVGLLSLKERMELIGGELIVESQPGRGTRVVGRCPIAPLEDLVPGSGTGEETGR